jgi:hypothetical protein
MHEIPLQQRDRKFFVILVEVKKIWKDLNLIELVKLLFSVLSEHCVQFLEYVFFWFIDELFQLSDLFKDVFVNCR